MSIDSLKKQLYKHADLFYNENDACYKTISLLDTFGVSAFDNDNWVGHITGSMLITNPERTQVLLMFHKKFQRWQQFGGHSDGFSDVFSTAMREFHEESGVTQTPICDGEIFYVDVHPIGSDLKGNPPHFHHDIMYLGIISYDAYFEKQESEVDDIRWFPIQNLHEIIEPNMMKRIYKIKHSF